MNRLQLMSLFLGGIAVLMEPPSALAQVVTVTVRVVDSVGRPADGTVTLRGPSVATCRTVAGRCQLRVPPGSWTATLIPVRDLEDAPSPRRLQLGAGSTTITLRTVARAATPPVQFSGRTSAAVRSRTPASTPPRLAPAPRGTTVNRAAGPATAPAAVRATRATSTGRPVVVARRPTGPGLQAAARTTRSAPRGPSVMAAERPAVVAHPSSGRDLSQGRRLSAQATMLDAQGRPTDATLTLRQGTALVGTARSVAGRVALYDVAPGTYQVTARFARTAHVQRRTVTIGSAAARLTFRDR